MDQESLSLAVCKLQSKIVRQRKTTRRQLREPERAKRSNKYDAGRVRGKVSERQQQGPPRCHIRDNTQPSAERR